jgi:hypothetical protein
MNSCEEAQYTDELIEDYALGKLASPADEQFEEHLLLCSSCQERLVEAEEFIAAIRVYGHKPEAARVQGTSWFSRLGETLKAATNSMSLGYAAGLFATVALAVVFLRPPSGSSAGIQAIELKAIRGTQSARAIAGSSLKLGLDLQGLPRLPEYRIEITDQDGASVWTSAARPLEGRIVAQPGRMDAAGIYWVRVYESGLYGSLLREYPLQVRR